MKLASTNRKALIALAIVVAFVAIVVPTCRMVGCSMGAMPLNGMGMAGFWGTCGGSFVTSAAPAAVVPSGADALTLALVSVLAAALIAFQPKVRVVRITSHPSDPPPPPEDPLGMRQLV
ncbi:MAG TPA: hypothetical protein VFG89_09945 [Coriobacteriia bacterium]|nr:hypothetical protein [Coriobacteriia bacterium]